MPTYDFLCQKCGFKEERLQKMSDPLLIDCPKCKNKTFVRQTGAGLALHFKGSGFYITDYADPPSKEEKKEKAPPG